MLVLLPEIEINSLVLTDNNITTRRFYFTSIGNLYTYVKL